MTYIDTPTPWGNKARFKPDDKVAVFWSTGRWDTATVMGPADGLNCPYMWRPISGEWEYALMVHYVEGLDQSNVAGESEMIPLTDKIKAVNERERKEWVNNKRSNRTPFRHPTVHSPECRLSFWSHLKMAIKALWASPRKTS